MIGKQTLDIPVGKFEDYYASLLQWFRRLPAHANRTATAAAMMRFLRTQSGFVAFVRQHPTYNRAINIVGEKPELVVVSGGSTTNPRIRLRAPAPTTRRM